MSTEMGLDEFTSKLINSAVEFKVWVTEIAKEPGLTGLDANSEFDEWLRLFGEWMGKGAPEHIPVNTLTQVETNPNEPADGVVENGWQTDWPPR